MAAEQPVTQIMSTEVLAAAPETSIVQVARTMSEHGVSGLPVIDAESNLQAALKGLTAPAANEASP